MSDDWQPTGWWRATLPSGKVWAESSNEAEIRQAAKDCPDRCLVERHMRRVDEYWEIPDTPADETWHYESADEWGPGVYETLHDKPVVRIRDHDGCRVGLEHPSRPYPKPVPDTPKGKST